MRREWEPEELIACWTLLDADRNLLANKSGATRLGFVALLKFFELEGRFPRHHAEVPPAAVSYLASQVGVEPGLFEDYSFEGRTVEYHRAQVRAALGFREATRADEEDLASWLAELTGPDRETQEISMLALHLLQSALVYINTILLQRVLQEPDWAGRLTAEDRSGLTPLFWSNVNPYGTFRLGMDRRLDLEQGSGPVVPGSVSPAAT